MNVLFLINKQKEKMAKTIKRCFFNSSFNQSISFVFNFFDQNDREKVFIESVKSKSDKIVIIDDYDSYGFIFFCKQKDFFCTNAYNAKLAKLAILHNNANVLVIGYKTVCFLKIYGIIKNFLTASFEGGRHTKRLEILHNSFTEQTKKADVNFSSHNDAIVVASDHGGYELKNKIVYYLKNKHFKVIDVGTYSKAACDYPVFGIKLGKTMFTQGQKGIVFCGSGMGISNSANKFYYLRCINAYSKTQLLNGLSCDPNVMGLGGRFISFRKARKMVDIFLKNEITTKDHFLKHCGLELKK